MINNVSLTGRITKELEQRNTNGGKAFVNFTLAVDRHFKDKNGERQTDFIQIQAWGKPAEILCGFARKGSLIGIEGRIQTRNYENQQGQRVYVTEVVAEHFTFLESKQDKGQPAQKQQQPADPWSTQPAQQQSAGQQTSNAQYGGYSVGQQIDIPDSDMPF